MTTYTEDFNRVSLGTLAPNGATYVNNGGWVIDSNQALAPDAYEWSPLVYDHGLTDPTIEVGIVDEADVNDYWGIIVRYQDVNNWIIANIAHGSTTLNVFRREAGFDYTIQNHTMASANPLVLKVVNVNDSMSFYADGAFVGTTTSSFLTGNTFAGIASFVASRYDNLIISTVVAAEEVVNLGWGFIPTA